MDYCEMAKTGENMCMWVQICVYIRFLGGKNMTPESSSGMTYAVRVIMKVVI